MRTVEESKRKVMESKKISHTARIIIGLYNVALFSAVWVLYYNGFAFQKFATPGAVTAIIIYILLYFALCELYRSFKIASSSIAETVLSQVISFGIADLLMYVVSCLVANNYVNVFPGVGTVVAQVAGTVLLVWAFKRIMTTCIKPAETVLICGDEISESEVALYIEKLNEKYAHLFEIKSIVKENAMQVHKLGGREKYQTVMLYEVSGEYKGSVIKHCIGTEQNIYFTPSVEDILIANCEPRHLLDTPLMKYDYTYRSTMTAVVKRVIDVVVSLLGIIVTSPIMLVTALAIKLEDRGPAIFKQKRCSLGGREFNIYKFRSMTVAQEKEGVKLATVGDNRITKVGKVIRKFRIDELPQMFNILFGHMSIVGPRAMSSNIVAECTEALPEFALRTRVKAGLTGYAQIFGKYNTTAYDKLRLDLMYIENQSIMLDLKLMLLTIKVIFVPESTEGVDTSKAIDVAFGEHKMAQEEMAAGVEGK